MRVLGWYLYLHIYLSLPPPPSTPPYTPFILNSIDFIFKNVLSCIWFFLRTAFHACWKVSMHTVHVCVLCQRWGGSVYENLLETIICSSSSDCGCRISCSSYWKSAIWMTPGPKTFMHNSFKTDISDYLSVWKLESFVKKKTYLVFRRVYISFCKRITKMSLSKILILAYPAITYF